LPIKIEGRKRIAEDFIGRGYIPPVAQIGAQDFAQCGTEGFEIGEPDAQCMKFRRGGNRLRRVRRIEPRLREARQRFTDARYALCIEAKLMDGRQVRECARRFGNPAA